MIHGNCDRDRDFYLFDDIFNNTIVLLLKYKYTYKVV